MHIEVLVGNALGWGDPIIQQGKTMAGLLDEDDSGADSAVFGVTRRSGSDVSVLLYQSRLLINDFPHHRHSSSSN